MSTSAGTEPKSLINFAFDCTLNCTRSERAKSFAYGRFEILMKTKKNLQKWQTYGQMVARYRTSMFLYGCPDQDETKWGNLFQIHSTKLRRTLFIKKIFPGTFAVYIVCNGIVTFSLSDF